MKRTEELHKLIKLTGDRAKLDAKANETYIEVDAIYRFKGSPFLRQSVSVMIRTLPAMEAS